MSADHSTFDMDTILDELQPYDPRYDGIDFWQKLLCDDKIHTSNDAFARILDFFASFEK